MKKGTSFLLAGALVLSVGGYGVADAYDVVPGFLTLTPPPADPVAYPALSVPAPAASATPEVKADAKAGDLQSAVDTFAANSRALGSRVAVMIRDVSSGTVLAQRDADTAYTTASSVKILPAAAALLALGESATLPTRVMFNGMDTLTLVGSGNMRLTADDLAKLATDAAAGLHFADVNSVALRVDDSVFTGPTWAPGWGDLDRPWIQPVMGLGVNSGKSDGSRADGDPALAAGGIFAARLKDAGITVTGTSRGKVGADDVLMASHESETVQRLVSHTLKGSDNTTSEATARLVARSRGEEGTFDAGRAAVLAQLADAGFELGDTSLADSCGLSSGTKVSARLLTDIVAAAASGKKPELAPLIASMPVSHLDGTLRTRLADSPGLVRAKTGTLVTAISLSGVLESEGRQFAFSILAPEVQEGNFQQARKELDAFIATLARLGT
ncbi:hypothetical protein BSZ39_05515 [Bowdeniella nasicola]|uniref:D-alanyl-D-alanine carboxypeptidase / D-alanyl-D-alanine-endopeptidase (Penicillin-binding protein 4) n=1 Tax=Bowdeniella nasicola TaxID=208480 RepID=A0A1Q5Q2W6_9ACTO|nr:D-alanyl-D-alanine carboxypeptidase [Bowdeniella nasicola]OKL54178.1 hypothetical protein BSZ39_05515 [Bowdeniella nasicola]